MNLAYAFLVVAFLGVVAPMFYMGPFTVLSLGTTAAGACQVDVSDAQISFLCSGGSGIAQCDDHTWRFDWNGIIDNVGGVPLSEAVCHEYGQTWIGDRCRFDNLGALEPYATGDARFLSVSMPGEVSREIHYAFPLGANLNVCGTSGGSASIQVESVWKNPARQPGANVPSSDSGKSLEEIKQDSEAAVRSGTHTLKAQINRFIMWFWGLFEW